MVKFQSDEDIEKAKEALRFFKIDEKSLQRSLPFDQEMLGKNKNTLFDRSLFVKRANKFKLTDEEEKDPALQALLDAKKKPFQFTADELKSPIVSGYSERYKLHFKLNS
jgi:hypothetical protein